jgi:uncharacterized protein (TIGR01777 family)
MKIAISGSGGLVGSALQESLAADGHAITPIVRQRRRGRRAAASAYWNPDVGEVDEASLEAHDVVIHLAGESLFGVWTRRRKKAIRRSRVQGTQLLASALAGLRKPPALLITASAIGYYGDRPGEELDETASGAQGFIAGVVRGWEAANEPAEVAGVRTVQLRFGLVLAREGGMLGAMLPAFRLGLGAVVGPGDQIWSWIARSEIPHVIRHVIATPSLRGPVNATAPQAVTSREFSQTLGRVLQRPVPLHVPRFVVALAPGGLGHELALASASVVPARLLASGYRFRQPELEPALRELLARN